jgi:hypothetical protein
MPSVQSISNPLTMQFVCQIHAAQTPTDGHRPAERSISNPAASATRSSVCRVCDEALESRKRPTNLVQRSAICGCCVFPSFCLGRRPSRNCRVHSAATTTNDRRRREGAAPVTHCSPNDVCTTERRRFASCNVRLHSVTQQIQTIPAPCCSDVDVYMRICWIYGMCMRLSVMSQNIAKLMLDRK